MCRAVRGRRPAGSGGGRSGRDGGAAALRPGRDGARHTHDHRHPQCRLRRGPRRLPAAGARPDPRRRRRAPARDRAGHAEREGGRHRDHAGDARGRPGAPAAGQRDHRADGDHAGRAGGRGALRLARAPRPVRHRAQLRYRPGVHDRSPPHAPRRRHLLRERVPERGPAGRARPLRGDPVEPGAQDAALRRRGVGEPHRRLLRHDAGAHPRIGPPGRRPGAEAPDGLARAGGERDRGRVPVGRQPAPAGGGADQRDRLAPVQGPRGAGPVRRRRRGGPGPGAGRRPGPRRVPGEPRPRRGGRHGPLHVGAHPRGQGPADDRLDRRRGDRASAAPLPGQGHRQLDQPRGRTRALRARRAPPPHVRGGGGRRLHRRGQAAGHGGDPRAQARHRAALPRPPHGALRHARPRPDLRRAGVPDRHRGRELRGRRGGDRRGHPGHQGAPAGVPDDPRHLQRLVRPAHRGPRGAERRLPLPLHEGRARLRHRQQRAARALRLDP